MTQDPTQARYAGAALIHGPRDFALAHKGEYNVWNGIHRRCLYPSQRSYANFGGRGIKVCERWRCFATFLADVGPKPSPRHQLLRRNNDKDFTPDNCYWSSSVERRAARPRPLITAEELRELLHYDPQTGVFTWKIDRGLPAHIVARAGEVAGQVDPSNGYMQINIRQRRYLMHRLAVLWVTGEWPSNHVDHRDGQRTNNAWANLRDVPHAINAQNLRRVRRDNKLGIQGVQETRDGRFIARLRTDGVTKRLGTFADPHTAHQAYLTAKRQHHIGCTI